MPEIDYGHQMNPWARPKYDKEDLLTRGTDIGIVNDDVHVEEYDEILEAQLEWMRNARGD